MTIKQKLITANELLLMPRDGNRYELIRGVLVQKMPTGDRHRITVSRFDTALSIWSDENDYGSVGAGEPGYRLDRAPDTVRAPDVVWIAPGRVPEGTQGYPEIAPDLAVEVKSPSNSNPEMAAKAAMWLSYGSKEVWVANPKTTTVTIYRPGALPVTLSEDDTLDGGDLLPGFTTPVWRLFRRRR
jgi:Uma2 family endonuclease